MSIGIVLFLLLLVPTVLAQVDQTSTFTDNLTILGSLNVTGEGWVNGSKICTVDGNDCPIGLGDTNETIRVDNLVGLDCPSGQLVIGVFNNGTVKCEDDSAAGIGTMWEVGVVIAIFGTVMLSFYNFTLLDRDSLLGGNK